MTDALRSLERAADFLRTIPGATEKASARALNAAAAAGREAAVRAIADRYAVHAGDVREKISLRAAAPSRLEAEVVGRSGTLPLGYFPHTPSAPGTGGPGRPPLRAEILRGQQRTIGGAFVAPIGGKPRIMIRTGGKTATGKAAIKALAAVPMARMLAAPSVVEAVEQRAIAALDAELDKQIDRAFKGAV